MRGPVRSAPGAKGTRISATRTVLAGFGIVLLAACGTTVIGAGQAPSAPPRPSADYEPSADLMDPSVGIDGIFIGADPQITNGVITYPAYGNLTHVRAPERVAYDRFPPVGGPHDQVWADCDGTVYRVPVRTEHLVHSLEHGAVWIAYDPDLLAADGVATLADLVTGQSHLVLSPYPGLGAPISLQSWGHQLSVTAADDPRIVDYITALRQNVYITPEVGATCSQPEFDIDNPPPFDPSAPGSGAVPMTEPTEDVAPPTGPPVITTA